MDKHCIALHCIEEKGAVVLLTVTTGAENERIYLSAPIKYTSRQTIE